MEGRKCQEPGLENLKAPMSVTKGGEKYTFCPGKATWHEGILELYDQCVVATETGILPIEGGLLDQEATFYGVFPFFIDQVREKRYARTWSDVADFTNEILKTIRKMFGKG